MFLVCCPSDWVMLYEKVSAKSILHAMMLIPEIVSLVFLYCSRRRQSNVEPNKVRSLCSTDSFHISFLYAPGVCILCYGLNMLMLGLWSHPLLIAHHLYIIWLNCRRILRAYLVLLFCTTKLMCEISCEKTGTLFRKSDYWFTNSIVILFFSVTCLFYLASTLILIMQLIFCNGA